LAKNKGIPVYTIAAGNNPSAEIPDVDLNTGRYLLDRFGRKTYSQRLDGSFDEETLRKISSLTDGKFFRAMDLGTAEAAFAAIDQRQRIEFDAKAQIRAHEWFAVFAAPGLAVFFAGLALARPGRWGRAI
jgi:Ca-activated chloride channel family protein